MNAPDTITATVLTDRLADLREAVEGVNARAAKLGLAPTVTLTVGAARYRQAEAAHPLAAVGVVQVESVTDVTLVGQSPVLPGGWTLLATIDHRLAEPIVRSVPGVDLPAGQRARGPICDHCGQLRRRAETFVLAATDGRVVQVGRQCLGDFLGARGLSPAALVAAVLWVDTLDVESFAFPGGGGERRHIGVTGFVQVTGAVIALDGWRSRAAAQADGDDAPTTAETVTMLLYGSPAPSIVASYSAALTDEIRAEAVAAVAWAAAIADGESDYLLNLRSIARSERVSYREVGLLASLLPAYRRAQAKAIAPAAASGAATEHVGTIGQRLTLGVRLAAPITAHESAYGTTYRASLLDQGGHSLVWWASKLPHWLPTDGTVVQVAATVRAHNTYRGTAQTTVTRVSPAVTV